MFYLLIFVSVSLSAVAQTLFRIGMTRPDVARMLQESEGVIVVARAVALSPYIWGGLFAYGFGTLLWLLVLSRIPVSLAYPFVALGIILTTLSGMLLLGEQVSRLSVAGICLIAIGILVTAMGRAA